MGEAGSQKESWGEAATKYDILTPLSEFGATLEAGYDKVIPMQMAMNNAVIFRRKSPSLYAK